MSETEAIGRQQKSERMSTDLYLRCQECQEVCDPNMRISLKDVVKYLWERRQELAALLYDSPRGYVEIEIESHGPAIPNFLAEHKDHTVLLYDEYGYLYSWETLERVPLAEKE